MLLFNAKKYGRQGKRITFLITKDKRIAEREVADVLKVNPNSRPQLREVV
jgi:hypothetical protein